MEIYTHFVQGKDDADGEAFAHNCTNCSHEVFMGVVFTVPQKQLSEPLYIMYCTYICTVVLFGLVNNSFAIYVFVKDKGLLNGHNIFIIGLAISDAGMCIFGNWMIIIAAADHQWVFGRGGCIYYGFATTMIGLSQISLLAVIALDRYFVIVQSTFYNITIKKAYLMMSCCYGYGFFWAILPALGWSSYQLEGMQLRCAINWRSKEPKDYSYLVTIVVFAFMIPLIVMVVSYGSICHQLFLGKHRKLLVNVRQSTGFKHRRRRETRLAITVFLMIGAFLVSWAPYSIVTLIIIFGEVEHVSQTWTLLPPLMMKTSIIWNPIIYVMRHRNFRKACLLQLQRMFLPQSLCCKQ